MSIKNQLKKIARRLYKFHQYQHYRTLLHKNRELQDKYRGKRIFILGNGASLNDIDLSLLKDEYTISCNYIALHKDFSKLDLCFFADPSSKRSIWATPTRGPVPTGTVKNGFRLLHDKTRPMKTQFVFNVTMKNFIEQNRLFSDHEVFYVMAGDGLIESKKVETDLTKPISTMDGALYFMINLALYMGFKDIYLCGCGYTYYPQQSGHFYEDWTKEDHVEADPRHEILNRIASQQGTTIFNVVPESFKSPVYRLIPVRDLQKIVSSQEINEVPERAVS